MRQSVNEFKQLILKSTRGVGVPFGVGEDICDLAVWLQGCFISDASIIVKALQAIDSGKSRFDINHDELASPQSEGLISSIFLSVMVSDSIQNCFHKKSKDIFIKNIDYPLLVGAAAIRCHRKYDATSSLLVFTKNLKMSSFRNSKEIEIVTNHSCMQSEYMGEHDLSIKVSQEIVRDHKNEIILNYDLEKEYLSKMKYSGLDVSSESIALLKKFSSRLEVPESQRSKMFGAGADISDSD